VGVLGTRQGNVGVLAGFRGSIIKIRIDGDILRVGVDLNFRITCWKGIVGFEEVFTLPHVFLEESW